jgi:hypothetical protein
MVNAKILAMGAYDLVLGMDWMEMHRPMICYWLEKWIDFPLNGSSFRLQGIYSSQSRELNNVSVEQVLK